MQDYANQISQMFVGWQIEIADLPRLVSIGRGRIEIDLLDGSTTIDGTPSEPFDIAPTIRGWLDEAKVRDQLDAGYVLRVNIACDFDVVDSQNGADSRRELLLDCTVVVDAQSGSWTGNSRKAEIWRRSGSGSWIVEKAGQ